MPLLMWRDHMIYREIKALQECSDSHHVCGIKVITLHVFDFPQVIRLREMFPQGHGFVLVFDYMLSDLSQVIRNMEQQLTEVRG